MNRFYLIIPLVLLAVFGGVYWQYSQQRATEDLVRAAMACAAKVAAQAQQDAVQRRALEEANQRTTVRLAEVQKKQEEQHARWAADTAQILAETARYRAQSDQLREELVTVEKQLNDARKTNAADSVQALALAREVELARIAKRNAELEVQRTTEILARRAAQTSLIPPASRVE